MAVHQDMETESSATMCDSDQNESLSVYLFPNEGAVCSVVLTLSSESIPLEKALELEKILGVNIGSEIHMVVGNSENDAQEILHSKLYHLTVGESLTFDIVNNDVVIKETGALIMKLISFQSALPITHLSSKELFDRAKQYKELGNKVFKNKCVTTAFNKYSRAVKYLILISDSLPKEEPGLVSDYKALRVHCYSNMAACQLLLKSYTFAVENCTKALNVDNNNVKALFRRASAYKELGQWDESLADLQKAQDLEPNNNSIKKEMTAVKTEVQNLNSNLAKAMSKMFTN